MDVMDDQNCFICGSKNEIGLKAKFECDHINHTASTKLVIDEKYQGWQGVIHGGIIAALLDETSFYACMGISMKLVTAELNIRYHKPLQTGSEVIVSAKLKEQKRNILFVEAKIESNNILIAKAETKMFILDYHAVK